MDKILSVTFYAKVVPYTMYCELRCYYPMCNHPRDLSSSTCGTVYYALQASSNFKKSLPKKVQKLKAIQQYVVTKWLSTL